VNLIAKDPLQRKIEIVNWIILGVVFFISLIFASFKFSLGVLLGGFICIVNFYWMQRDLRIIFEKAAVNPKGAIMFKYFIRLTISAVILYFLISAGTVNVIGLIIGLSVVMISIVLTVILTLTKKNFLEEIN
jgi:ATP synthase I chain